MEGRGRREGGRREEGVVLKMGRLELGELFVDDWVITLVEMYVENWIWVGG